MANNDNEKCLIIIDDNYGISVDGIDYSLRKITYNKKTGNRVASPVGYYSSIQKCLEAYLKESIHDGLESDKDLTIAEAVRIFEEKVDEFYNLIYDVFPEYTVVENK